MENKTILYAPDNRGQRQILYECDREACKNCNRDCHLTTDPAHAKNFTNFRSNIRNLNGVRMEWSGTYVEKKKDKSFTSKMITASLELLVVVGIISLGFKLVTWIMM